MQIGVELSPAHVAVAHILTATALLCRDGAIQHSISRNSSFSGNTGRDVGAMPFHPDDA